MTNKIVIKAGIKLILPNLHRCVITNYSYLIIKGIFDPKMGRSNQGQHSLLRSHAFCRILSKMTHLDFVRNHYQTKV